MGTFGEWLRLQRSALKLTRDEFANRIGCSVSMLRKMEDDERRPSTQIAELIANCLDIPVAERETFIRVARGELPMERLTPVSQQTSRSSISQVQAFTKNNLPVLPTPLIGRQEDVDTLTRLLRDPQCQLLTLVGPGGIGKTRLAIETASQCQNDFSDGVYFIPLAPVSSSRFIVPVIADAIGYTFQGKSALDPKAQLLNYLNKRQVLLLVDNLEHLLGDADVTDLFAELQECAARVKLLFTSRESVGLQGEWVFEIHGLPIPEGMDMEGTSVELFLQRARRAYVAFNATTEDYPAIVRICRLVDGMPLGIELAAAWVRTLTCDEIVHEIEHSLDFLSLSAKDLPARHRSMRAVFDHSWKLLSEEEQNVLIRLSVFEGGFSREAAQQVANAALPVLSALVTKSMIRRSGPGRYDQHESIRQYSRERLFDSGMQKEVSNRHFEFFLELAEQASVNLRKVDHVSWLVRLDTDYDNLRVALEWSLRFEHSEGEISTEQDQAVQGSIRLTGALHTYWWLRNRWSEGRKWLERALGQPSQEWGTRDRVRALNAAVNLALAQADYHKALQLADDHLALAKGLADPLSVAFAHRARGTILWKLKAYASASNQCIQALDLFRSVENRSAMAGVLQTLGRIATNQNDLMRAKTYLNESAQIFQEFGYTLEFNTVLSDLGLVAYIENDLSTARQHQETSLSLFRETNFTGGIEMALIRLGDVARCEKNYEQALTLYSEAMTIYRESGDKDEVASLLHNMGCVTQVLGYYSEAMSHFSEGLQLQVELNNDAGIAECLVGIGSVLLSIGQTERAARLFGASESLRENARAILWPANRAEYDHNLSRLYAAMDKEALEKAWEEGRTMSVGQVAIEGSRSHVLFGDESIGRGSE